MSAEQRAVPENELPLLGSELLLLTKFRQPVPSCREDSALDAIGAALTTVSAQAIARAKGERPRIGLPWRAHRPNTSPG